MFESKRIGSVTATMMERRARRGSARARARARARGERGVTVYYREVSRDPETDQTTSRTFRHDSSLRSVSDSIPHRVISRHAALCSATQGTECARVQPHSNHVHSHGHSRACATFRAHARAPRAQSKRDRPTPEGSQRSRCAQRRQLEHEIEARPNHEHEATTAGCTHAPPWGR